MKKRIAEIFNLIFGFRKFLLMLFIIVVSIVFRLKDLINGTEMVDLIKTTAIAFMSVNGVEHIMTVVKGHLDAKTAAAAGPADTDEADDEADDEEEVESEPKD